MSLLEAARVAARDAVNELEGPHDDIPPVLVALTPNGVLAAPLEMPPGQEDRDLLADFMAALIACSRAREVAFICTAWTAMTHLGDERRASEHPDRQETIVVAYQTSGDHKILLASLTRHEDRPPDMGLWTEDDSMVIGGRFAESMEAGLKLAEEVPNVPGLAEQLDAIKTPDDLSRMAMLLVRIMHVSKLGEEDDDDTD